MKTKVYPSWMRTILRQNNCGCMSPHGFNGGLDPREKRPLLLATRLLACQVLQHGFPSNLPSGYFLATTFSFNRSGPKLQWMNTLVFLRHGQYPFWGLRGSQEETSVSFVGGEGWFPPQKKQASPIDVLQTHQTGILRNGPIGSVKEPLRRMPDCLHLLLMSESEPRRCKSLKILGRSRAHDVRIKDET